MTVKKKNDKKLIKWAVISIVLLGIAFLTTAYVNGKGVVEEDFSLQWVSHTEYWRDDSASTIIRLADYRGNPYQVDECRVTILKPDKTIFVDDQPMVESNIQGNWYRTDSLAEAPLGTYEQEVTCTKGASSIKSSQSFHLNPALEQVKTLTELSNALDLDLQDVNVSISGIVSDTGEEISTNITNLNTSVSDLLTNINTGLTTEIQSGVSTLSTELNNVELTLTGVVQSTGQDIQTIVTTGNTSLTNLINSINLGLADQMASDLNITQTQLEDINLSINAVVSETGEQISTQISGSQDSLTNLINNISNNLASQMDFQTIDLNTALQDIDLSLSAQIQGTQETINANLSDVDTSLTNLINSLNTSLSTQITSKFEELSSQLVDVNLSLNAVVSETGEQINTNISASQTSITNLLNTINVDLTSEITNQFNNTNALIAQKFLDSDTLMNSLLSDLEVSVNGQVQATGNTLGSQLSDINSSISSLINNLIIGDLNVQLNGIMDQLRQDIQTVKDDTTWLVSNSINQEDMVEIESRFSSIDTSLSNLEQFCSQQDTNSSALCNEIYNIKTAVQIMSEDQSQKLDQINSTTLNTWNLLSGDITNNIDSLLTDIGIIRQTTEEISQTVDTILENQESQITARIIS